MTRDPKHHWSFRLRLQRSVTMGLPFVVAALAFTSCSNSVRVLSNEMAPPGDIGVIGSGPAYVGVDFSRVNTISQQEAIQLNGRLGRSVAEALRPRFKQSRSVSAIERLETDSTDLVVFIRAQNSRLPRQGSEISRSWIRLLVVGVLAEVYNIFALDLPAYRNNVVLPFAALALPLYELVYSSQYEDVSGRFSLEYQLYLLKPDGSVLRKRSFADSAKVLMQADASIGALRVTDLLDATKETVSGAVHSFVLADSSTIRHLGEEMKNTYPLDCDRVLTFKRNVYRVLDDSLQAASHNDPRLGQP